MASGRVIDSLVVTLGLNAATFKQGISGATNELMSFTRRLTGLFLTVRGLEDVVDYFKDLHTTLTDVGYSARNLGVLGTQLRQFSEVSELFGGRAEDAASSIQGLQASLFNLRFMGQMSEPLMMMQRFGVAYMTASGQMLNFRAIALNAARVIGEQAQTQGLDPGQRYQLALSMGFQGGIASAVAQGGKGLEQVLKEAKTDQKALTEQTIRGQVTLARRITENTYQLQASNSTILAKLTPDIERAISIENSLVNSAIPKLTDAINTVNKFFEHPPQWMKNIEAYLKDIAGAGKKTLGTMQNTIGTPGTVATVLTAGMIGKALLGAGGRLLMKLPGLGRIGGIAGAAGELSVPEIAAYSAIAWGADKMWERFAPSSYSTLGSWSSLGNWLIGVTGSPAAAAAGGGIAIPPSLLAPPPTPGATRPSGATASWGPGGATGGWGPGTVIEQVGPITINTNSTNSKGIANDLDGAVKRKLLTSSADRGQS